MTFVFTVYVCGYPLIVERKCSSTDLPEHSIAHTLCSQSCSTNTFIINSFIKSVILLFRIIRARELIFWENVHPPTICQVLGVKFHLSGVTYQVSWVNDSRLFLDKRPLQTMAFPTKITNLIVFFFTLKFRDLANKILLFYKMSTFMFNETFFYWSIVWGQGEGELMKHCAKNLSCCHFLHNILLCLLLPDPKIVDTHKNVL